MRTTLLIAALAPGLSFAPCLAEDPDPDDRGPLGSIQRARSQTAELYLVVRVQGQSSECVPFWFEAESWPADGGHRVVHVQVHPDPARSRGCVIDGPGRSTLVVAPDGRLIRQLEGASEWLAVPASEEGYLALALPERWLDSALGALDIRTTSGDKPGDSIGFLSAASPLAGLAAPLAALHEEASRYGEPRPEIRQPDWTRTTAVWMGSLANFGMLIGASARVELAGVAGKIDVRLSLDHREVQPLPAGASEALADD